MTENKFVSAIIVAAGSASRMNKDKIVLPLGGIPCIGRTLLAFEKAATVNEIIVVTRKDLIPVIDKIAADFGVTKYVKSVEGGSCRQESAALGFNSVSENCQFVAVHDGARPLITPEEIDGVNEEAFACGSAICCTKVKDTVKIADKNGFVETTLPRESLVAVSTPQTFSKEIYSEMVEKFKNDFCRFTDDSAMAEPLGYNVKLYFCSYSNIKITTPEDALLAEELLNSK
ncbi:MAG: 2-C-methyl-D-erythritol 4-phosphate cytidylyltransferase [Clostridia bacterium]|nr:2-C-methyl-D-erythritol 4-phosphate cytidylyltransferase [Clostridia bacterium]